MKYLIHKDVIDIGDTVYFIFEGDIRISPQKQAFYNNNDALNVVSVFDRLSGDKKNPIITSFCKVEDANGYVFDVESKLLSLNPNDIGKRKKLYQKMYWKMAELTFIFSLFIFCISWIKR